MSSVDWPLTPVAELAAGRKWAINGGPFGSKLVSRDYVNSGVPVIRGANLPFDKRFHSDDFVFVSEEKADELLANNAHPGDVIITQRGTLGQVGIIPLNSAYPRYVISQSQMKITVDPARVDADWLYYCFRSPAYQNELINRASSSGVPHINLGVLREFKLPLPDLPTQRRIASILSAYDDLIENNTRRIAILEEIARRIYEEWFVRFRFPGHEQVKMVESELGLIPEGWGVGCLCDVFDNVRQSTKPGEHLRPRRYVPIDCIGRRTLVLPETRPYEEAQSSLILFETDDILFGAMRPYFHKVAIAPCAGVTRTTCFVLRTKSSEFGAYGTMLAFSDPVVAYASAHIQGATIPYAVWDGSLANYAIPIPPESLLRQFNELVQPMLMWLRRAMFRQENLRATRDLLLPKLISGELDVSTLPEPEEAIAA